MTDSTPDVDAEVLAVIAEAPCLSPELRFCADDGTTAVDMVHPECVLAALKSRPDLCASLAGMEQVGWMNADRDALRSELDRAKELLREGNPLVRKAVAFLVDPALWPEWRVTGQDLLARIDAFLAGESK